MFRIAKINLEELDEIFKIQEDAIVHPWNRQMFNEEVESENSRLYIYYDEDKNKVASYVLFQKVLDEATLLSVATDAKYRAQGIATDLLNYAFGELEKEEIHQIFLEVRSKNEKAIKLYIKNNFEKLSVRKGYYKDPQDDAICMVKKI